MLISRLFDDDIVQIKWW